MHSRNIGCRHSTWIIILRTEDYTLPLCWQRWYSVIATPYFPPKPHLPPAFPLSQSSNCILWACVYCNVWRQMHKVGWLMEESCDRDSVDSCLDFTKFIMEGKSLLGDRWHIICNICWRKCIDCTTGSEEVQHSQSVYWGLSITIYLPSHQNKQIIHHK